MKRVKKLSPERFPGTAVFLTTDMDQVSLLMMRYLEFVKVLNEDVVLLIPIVEDVPRIQPENRVEEEDLGEGIRKLVIHFGYMENPLIQKKWCTTLNIRE